MKKPLCEVCKLRRVSQQDFKTEEEKKRCMTCQVSIKFLIDTLELLQGEFERRGVRRRICCVLDENHSTAEDKLLQAMFNKPRIYFALKDKPVDN